jgi:mRNA-degrading endonuclease RelE of RelBE toxin-antitoxin system
MNKRRVKEALQVIVNSPDPRLEAEQKHTVGSTILYGYEIGLKYRLLFEVKYEERKIKGHRVCSHEEVYL